jgi:hypothetical protein
MIKVLSRDILQAESVARTSPESQDRILIFGARRFEKLAARRFHAR